MKFLRYKPSSDVKRLATNVAFSGFGQFVTLASPLLITPYLIRTVGIEKFGVIALAQSVMMYVSYFADYSFNIDATQEASVYRNDVSKLTVLFGNVFWAKLLLMLAGMLFVLVAIAVVPVFRAHWLLFLLSFSIVVGKVLLPQWLLIGTERIKEFTIITTVSKVIVYTSVFFLIRTASDYNYVNLIWGGGEILLAPFIYGYVWKRVGIAYLPKPSFQQISQRIRIGWPLFASNSVNSIYVYSNLIILSLFATPRELGSYAIAEKVIVLVKQISGTVFQTTYPHVCRLAAESTQRMVQFLRRETYLFALGFGAIGLGILVFAEAIITFFANEPDPTAVTLLRWLSFAPLLVSMNMSASQVMLANGIRKRYLQVITLACVVNVVVNFATVPFLSAMGTVIAILLTEVVNTVCVHLALARYHPALQVFLLRVARPNPNAIAP